MLTMGFNCSNLSNIKGYKIVGCLSTFLMDECKQTPPISSPAKGFRVHGIYVDLLIMDEEALVRTNPLHVESISIPIETH